MKKGQSLYNLLKLQRLPEILVGMRGFEPPASASRTLRSSQTEPHPVSTRLICQPAAECKPKFYFSALKSFAAPGLPKKRKGVLPLRFFSDKAVKSLKRWFRIETSLRPCGDELLK